MQLMEQLVNSMENVSEEPSSPRSPCSPCSEAPRHCSMTKAGEVTYQRVLEEQNHCFSLNFRTLPNKFLRQLVFSTTYTEKRQLKQKMR